MPLASSGLERLLPDATDAYVALLTAEPNVVAGTYVEPTDSGYARVTHSAWTAAVVDGRPARRNGGTIIFPDCQDKAMVVNWWAVFDALATGTGNLLAAGPLLNGGSDPQPQVVAVGIAVRFNTSDLQILG